MRVVHIVGRQDHGKTTLICELLVELSGRGLRVATLKHSANRHELDRPGKDSHRHARAGARPAAVATPDQLAVFLPCPEGADPLALLAPLLDGCDLVLVEGFVERPGSPKVEVWREAVGTPPLAGQRNDIAAVVSDGSPAAPVPVWPRSDVRGLADRLLALAAGA